MDGRVSKAARLYAIARADFGMEQRTPTMPDYRGTCDEMYQTGLLIRAERAQRDRRNSDEAANPGGLEFVRIHRLLWGALDHEAAEFRQLLAKRQQFLEGG